MFDIFKKKEKTIQGNIYLADLGKRPTLSRRTGLLGITLNKNLDPKLVKELKNVTDLEYIAYTVLNKINERIVELDEDCIHIFKCENKTYEANRAVALLKTAMHDKEMLAICYAVAIVECQQCLSALQNNTKDRWRNGDYLDIFLPPHVADSAILVHEFCNFLISDESETLKELKSAYNKKFSLNQEETNVVGALFASMLLGNFNYGYTSKYLTDHYNEALARIKAAKKLLQLFKDDDFSTWILISSLLKTELDVV
jgi:hypothetical protein